MADHPADAAAVAATTLLRDGHLTMRRALAPGLVADIEQDLAASFAATPFCEGDFYGARTKRFGRLLLRSPGVAAMVVQPQILAIAKQVLGPWCDCIQLNLTQATEIHPEALAQFPHRDQDMWRGPVGEIEYLLNVMWPLTPFRRANGATLIWPHSHGGAALTSDPGGSPVAAEGDPGDAVLFLGSTLHGAGANQTDHPRRGIIVSYCLGWLKPYENQWLAYPPNVARRFPAELAALVGYRQHRPNLGNYEGRCPSILLGDIVPDRLGAVDALRPDQAALLDAFVRGQRTPVPAS